MKLEGCFKLGKRRHESDGVGDGAQVSPAGRVGVGSIGQAVEHGAAELFGGGELHGAIGLVGEEVNGAVGGKRFGIDGRRRRGKFDFHRQEFVEAHANTLRPSGSLVKGILKDHAGDVRFKDQLPIDHPLQVRFHPTGPKFPRQTEKIDRMTRFH